jgi:large subunit ribosomal protein L15
MKTRLTLSDIGPARGSRFSKRRIGRGVGSGMGKTATKGHKGQKARSGWSHPASFEGGQMPLVRRLPKVGFNSPFRVAYKAVNIGLLNSFEDGAVVTPDEMEKVGLHDGRLPIKVLAKGELKKKLTVKAHAFSDAAKAAIQGAGGSTEILG